ncbi:N-acetylmuramoyl-L-alanine amidase [Pseudoflavonifractor phocaeensis]|uniref:peptidoglycan recognition protein family protein n=1 Tax=Pseudoflavonifractor phocaeensis TaxID=1870988 RepID=UPI001959AF0B|nr:peptidoglycan recognition family protein [Pseudoflavonifractor phocaeensis]MBM6925772.1 N-acetylmuramoyl-L-alanine amidase [Pseudoflavonifractor phocaeensis]
MSNSTLISYTKLSPNKNSPRNHKIDTITIHHMAAVNATIEACGAGFAQSSRQASANYGIGSDGRIALYVDEADRSWASSNGANDHRAVTIEVANSDGEPNWPVSEKAYTALIDLCTDICRRNGISKLVWATSKSDRVDHRNGANMTVHQDFAATACPGPYLLGKMADIAAQVNARLSVNVEPASEWAQEAWQKAANLGIFDGTDPQGPMTREQAALVLDRLGLLEGGS